MPHRATKISALCFTALLTAGIGYALARGFPVVTKMLSPLATIITTVLGYRAYNKNASLNYAGAAFSCAILSTAMTITHWPAVDVPFYVAYWEHAIPRNIPVVVGPLIYIGSVFLSTIGFIEAHSPQHAQENGQ